MRRHLLVFLAIGAAFAATFAVAPPAPAEARSLLGLLTSPLRALGVRKHARHHYHYRRGRPAKYASRTTEPNPRMLAAGAGIGIMAAALYWPRAFDDLAGYTFAIGSTSKEQFWSHGFNDIFAGVIATSDANRSPRARRRGSAEVSSDAPPEACRSVSPPSDDDPNSAANVAFKQIEQRVVPTPAQRDALDELRAAMIKADQRINTPCVPALATASPPERLKAISDRLWAMRQAMLTMRTPLEKAYNSLTDQQKGRLNGSGSTAKIACTGDMTEQLWPRDQIEQAIQPNDEQRATLEALRLTSFQMGQAIAYSCPRQPLVGPVQKLDAAGDRLNTMLYATMIVGRTLNTFYSSLTDEQKANLRSIGRSQGRAGQNRAAAAEPVTR
jgi:hypothetical protein